LASDQTQVIAGRDLRVYTAPNLSTNAFPLDTVDWGSAWGTPYVDAGFTRDGLRFRMNVQRQDVNVDQVVDPILRIATRRDLNMTTALAQINADNLSAATGQGTVNTIAPTTTVRGHTDYDVSGTITDVFITAGFDIRNPGDLEAVRIVGWKGLVTADVEMQFNVTDAARIAFDVALLPDTGLNGNINPARVARFRDVIAHT